MRENFPLDEVKSREGKCADGAPDRIIYKDIQRNGLRISSLNMRQHLCFLLCRDLIRFDKKRHGADLLGRDFIVLGRLIYMLGVCMKCAAMHPEASALAPPLMDMLSSRY